MGSLFCLIHKEHFIFDGKQKTPEVPDVELPDSGSSIDTDVLMAMDLEYRLTVAQRINCWCSRYLIERREVLLPELARRYTEVGKGEPEDFVHEFMLKLHLLKCPTMPQPENFAETIMRAYSRHSRSRSRV